ncbi:hypothetical protein Ddye_032576 [Dipteronia dyeriana]|uniref:Phosphomannose isomerase type I catalytic domain-containing protein n=1 Tax=Dipteronia dyeriana TaxID=168575 RepID=A0AAD9WKR9_9ROSI|nr:hypothetical protein Ddye_032576 [Dipteronia dyeriana]
MLSFGLGLMNPGPRSCHRRLEPQKLDIGFPGCVGRSSLENVGWRFSFLGQGTMTRTGDIEGLVLSIEKEMSIQVHPDKEFARALYKSQLSLYKDANHKPEMALALTEFEALCGFFSLQELKNVLCTIPEIVELVGGADASRILVCEPDSQEVKAGLQSIFSQILLSSKDKIGELYLN